MLGSLAAGILLIMHYTGTHNKNMQFAHALPSGYSRFAAAFRCSYSNVLSPDCLYPKGVPAETWRILSVQPDSNFHAQFQNPRYGMDERKLGRTQIAAARASLSERTARRIDAGELTSSSRQKRTWRTREDPLAGVWDNKPGLIIFLKSFQGIEQTFSMENRQQVNLPSILVNLIQHSVTVDK
jgi:hypothetical protein